MKSAIESSQNSSLLHLPNLNSIRFIAALLVIFSHIELYREFMGQESLIAIMGIFAGFGVDVFFALSGFLITYLLIIENKKCGKIHIGHFYVRRILRIWPLYYFILILGAILELYFHQSSPLLAEFNWDAFKYYFFFLPQVGKGFYIGSVCIAILWSIGVEELFYLLFPWLYNRIVNSPFKRLAGIILFLISAKIVAIYILYKYAPIDSWSGIIKTLTMIRFENLLIGSFMAFVGVSYRERLVNSVFLILPLFAVFVSIIFLAVMNVNFYISESIGPILQSVVTPFIVSSLVGAIIAFLALVPSLSGVLEHSVLNYLGKISFGLYVYHCLALTLLSTLPLAYAPSSWLTTFGCTIFLTVLFAAISYNYFEKPFLAKSSNYRHI